MKQMQQVEAIEDLKPPPRTPLPPGDYKRPRDCSLGLANPSRNFIQESLTVSDVLKEI